MADLTLPPDKQRRTWAVNALVLVGVAMTMVVFADNNHWAGALILAGVLTLLIYLLGTPAYRAQLRGPGRVQFNTMLGSHQVDLRNGFEVKRGYLGGPIVKVRRRRYRINGGLGGPGALRDWLDSVCTQP